MPRKKSTTEKTTKTKKSTTKKDNKKLAVNGINESKDMVEKLKSMSPEEAKSALEFIDNFKNADLDKIKSDAIEKLDSMNIPDDFTVNDMFYEEFKLWNINITDKVKLFIEFLCDTITKEKLNTRPSYDDVIKLIDKDGRLTATGFINILNAMIKDAQFVNTKFFPTLSRIRRADITPVLLLNQFIDYTYDGAE